jgi:SAM-dependent methyltransferase
MVAKDPVEFSTNLEKNSQGIWVSRTQAEISYPEEGNDHCLALEEDSFWFEHRNRCIVSLVSRFTPPGTLFDVGGGNGYVAAGLLRSGFQTALVEPGWQGITNARRRGVQTLVCSTLERAGFLPASLPAVGLFDVLEHISTQDNFLKTIYDLLVPGGRIYLTVPAFQSLWSTEDDYAGHYRRYTLQTLSAALVQAGFRVEYASYMFFMLPLPIWLFRALPTRLGISKQNDWDRYQQEHSQRSGIAGRVLDWLLAWELAQIRSGKRIWIGGSCLAAATK